MQRIATTTVAADLFGAGKDGFTSGNPNSQIAPTQLSASWCNGVQEELVGCIEASGQTLDAEDNLQVAKAIPYLAGHNIDVGANDLIFEWQSEAEPLFPGSAYQMKTQCKHTTGNLAALLCFFEPPNRSSGSVEYTIVVRNQSYALSASDTVIWRQEWRKSAGGVSTFTSAGELIYERNILGFTYALDFTAGTVGISVTPNPGDAAGHYRIFVKGECTIIIQDA